MLPFFHEKHVINVLNRKRVTLGNRGKSYVRYFYSMIPLSLMEEIYQKYREVSASVKTL